MKKILLISLMLILSLSLVSCGEKKVEDKVSEKTINSEQKQIEVSKKINDEMKDDIKDISDKVESGEMTDEEAKKAMLDSMDNSKTMQGQLELQKKQMPKMLEVIKFNKKCFEDVDNQSDAEDCVAKSKKLSKKLGLDDFFTDDEEDKEIEWNQDDKEATLAEMDDSIAQMEKMLPCIEKAKVLTDMMKCSTEE